jgi:hypothetical protein
MTHAGLLVARVLAASFLAVLFLQSGLDKVLDWKGNRGQFAAYFALTPLSRISGLMLAIVTVLEVLAGVTSAAGALAVASSGESGLAYGGAGLAATTLLGLFFGQRLAKDDAGAAAMVPYFIAAIGAVLLQSHR